MAEVSAFVDEVRRNTTEVRNILAKVETITEKANQIYGKVEANAELTKKIWEKVNSLEQHSHAGKQYGVWSWSKEIVFICLNNRGSQSLLSLLEKVQ